MTERAQPPYSAAVLAARRPPEQRVAQGAVVETSGITGVPRPAQERDSAVCSAARVGRQPCRRQPTCLSADQDGAVLLDLAEPGPVE